jgi:hypothetical protein
MKILMRGARAFNCPLLGLVWAAAATGCGGSVSGTSQGSGGKSLQVDTSTSSGDSAIAGGQTVGGTAGNAAGGTPGVGGNSQQATDAGSTFVQYTGGVTGVGGTSVQHVGGVTSVSSFGTGGTGGVGGTAGSGANSSAGIGGAAFGGVSSSGGTGGTSAKSYTGGAPTIAVLPKACKGIAIDPSATADSGTACVGVIKELEPTPNDIFIVLDRTMSMTYCLDGRFAANCPATPADPSRWQVVQVGMQQLLSDASFINKKPRMGLEFFGATGNPDDPTECIADTYKRPLLPIEDISTVADKINSAVQKEQQYLGGQTPWQPTLQGALEYAQAWQQANPQRATVVVFVTDGYPTECDTDMNNILETVGEFFAGVQGKYNTAGKPTIRTYVIGVGGDVAANGYNLDSIAQVGGTGSATIVNDAAAINDFAIAISNISKSTIKCDFALPSPPDGSLLDPDKVQVIFHPFDGVQQEIPMASSPAGCSTANGGWYFDNPMAPTKITLCGCSCANLGYGSVAVKLGCRPIPTIT